jgi:hypothetical protein
MIGAEHLRKQMQDPFFKYFKRVQGPGVTLYQRRLAIPPSARMEDYDKGVTREAADIYKQRTGKAYKGTLLPVAKDPTYKTSSFGKADAAKAKAEAKNFRRTASQKTLFGGNIRDLFPSLKRSLTRRRMAKKQIEKQGKTLGA